MIINRSGLTIRLSMSELRTIGRATQGVRLFKVAANDEISSVAKVAAAAEQELETLLDGEAPATSLTDVTADLEADLPAGVEADEATDATERGDDE